MNRYDIASVAKFSPLSFNELAAAPTMMRQKHDASIAAAEALRIQANPLKEHFARALEIKNQMDAEIAKNVDTLNKEGYNPTTFQNITKLNRQYQDMISPTGEIGQINNAKIVYDKAKEDFIQDAAKQNIGRDQALKLWDKKTAYYTGFGEDGKSITNVSPQGVAAYQDYNKDKQVAHSILGKTIRGVSSQGHHLEVDKQTGGVWEVTRNGKRVTNDNTRQVEAALKSTLDKWDNPNGEGKRWLMDSGDGLNRERIINDFNSMLETSDINDVSESANYNAPNIGGDGGDGSDGYGNMDIIDTQHALKIDKFTNRSHGTNVLELNKLESKIKNKTATQQDQIEYNSLQKFVNQTKAKVGSNPQYKEEKALEDKYNYDLVNKSSSKMRATYNAIKNGTLKGVYKVSGNTATVDPVKLKQQGYTLSEISEIKEVANKFLNNPHTKNITKIFSETNKLNNNYANYYNLFPNNSKGTKAYEDFNKNMESIFSGGTANTLQNLGLISAIQIDGTNDYDINDDDRNGIQKLLSNDIKPGSFSISGFSDNNVTGLPSIRMSFNTKDSSKGYTKGNYSWKNNKTLGQEGSKVSFDLDFKKLSNIPDNANKLQTMNALGKLAEFIYNNGGENGQNISKKILQTISENK